MNARPSLARPAVRPFAAAAAASLGLALAVVAAGPAVADEFTVVDGDQLAQAIADANVSPGGDTITIGGPITLTAALPTITSDLEIRGGGSTIDGDGNGVFVIASGTTVSISDLEILGAGGNGITITDADVTLTRVTVDGSLDDGLTMTGGSIEIIDSAFTGNGAAGIAVILGATSEATLSNLIVTGNADGVLLDASGSATVRGSGWRVADNEGDGIEVETDDDASVELSDSRSAENGGDGIRIGAGSASQVIMTRVDAVGNGSDGYEIDYATPFTTVSIIESTIEGNGEAGLEVNPMSGGSVTTVERSTLSGNAGVGVSAYILDDARLVVRNSTVSANGPDTECAAGIDVLGAPPEWPAEGSVELLHSTIWGNGTGDCPQVRFVMVRDVLVSHSIIAGSSTDLGASGGGGVTVEWSLLGTLADPSFSTPGLDAAIADPTNTIGDPLLAPLAADGGPTATHLPLPGSPALDGGDPEIDGAPSVDQRGASRIVGAAIDIGAVEVPAEDEPSEEAPAGALPPTGVDPAGIAAGTLLLLIAGAGALVARRMRRA